MKVYHVQKQKTIGQMFKVFWRGIPRQTIWGNSERDIYLFLTGQAPTPKTRNGKNPPYLNICSPMKASDLHIIPLSAHKIWRG